MCGTLQTTLVSAILALNNRKFAETQILTGAFFQDNYGPPPGFCWDALCGGKTNPGYILVLWSKRLYSYQLCKKYSLASNSQYDMRYSHAEEHREDPNQCPAKSNFSGPNFLHLLTSITNNE